MMNITSQYVIDMCNNYTTLKPCPKRSVYALVVTADGQHYCGANWITNECVTVCPRVEGDLYEKCKSVCLQPFHAETSAMDHCIDAGNTTIGATVYVVGHDYCCDGCIAAMTANGVSKAVVIDSGKEYSF